MKGGGKKTAKITTVAQKITPFLWFDGNAEEAARFYVSVFKRSKITDVVRYGSSGRRFRNAKGDRNDSRV